MRRLLPLILLAACAGPPERPVVASPAAAAVRAARLEVVDASRRPLVAARPGLVEQVARAAGRGSSERFSAVDAFRAAASDALEEKGLRVRTEAPSLPAFRVTLHDVDLRGGAAGAVAFVSAGYELLDATGHSVWATTQTRRPFVVGGPDLTRAQLVRIAGDAVREAVRSLPGSSPSVPCEEVVAIVRGCGFERAAVAEDAAPGACRIAANVPTAALDDAADGGACIRRGLAEAGWTEDLEQAADGPGTSAFVHRKGSTSCAFHLGAPSAIEDGEIVTAERYEVDVRCASRAGGGAAAQPDAPTGRSR